MKLKFKWLIYLPILFFFLPAFSFYVPVIRKIYDFYFISLFISLIMIFIFDGKYFFNKLYSVCTKTPLIYFIIFLLFITVNSLILSLFGVTSIFQTIWSITMQLVLNLLPTIVYFIYIISRHLGLQRFLKIFMLLFWVNLVLGFVAYIGRWFDITIINALFDFFNNARFLQDIYFGGELAPTTEKYSLAKRLCGLFEEPGFLGRFLFIFMPFVYTFADTKQILYKNKLFDKIFKKTLVPFTWINIILTLSPITLVFAFVITVVYYFRKILNLIKKYHILIIGIVATFIAVVTTIDFSDMYVVRIINVLTNIHSFSDFIIVEPSLATRIVSYVNQFQIFLHHPLTGVGFGNSKNFIFNQYLNSPIPLTPEIISKTAYATTIGKEPFETGSFMYLLLAENGIFAYLILVFYYIKTFKFINILHRFYSVGSYEYILSKSLFYTLLCLLILSIYNLTLLSQYLHLIIALCAIIIYDYKINNNIDKTESEQRSI